MEQFILWDEIHQFYKNEKQPLYQEMNREILYEQLNKASEKIKVQHDLEARLLNIKLANRNKDREANNSPRK